MRQVLRLLGTRYGLALGLVLAIALAVLVGKAVGAPRNPLPISGGRASAAPTRSIEPNDGESSPAPPPAPSTSPGAPDPRAVAGTFALAWLHHSGVSQDAWYAGLVGLCTPKLREELTGVDPAGVPAARITGELSVVPHDTAFVEVTVPVDAGTLTLRLLAGNGRWLVDGVDWQRS